MNGSVYKGERLKWVEERKRRKRNLSFYVIFSYTKLQIEGMKVLSVKARGGGGGRTGDDALCFCFNESKTLFFTFSVLLYVFSFFVSFPSRPCKT